MIPQKVEIRFDTFDIVHTNDSGPDEPYVWTFFVKLDGTVIDLLHPQTSDISVISPSGSHGDLNLPNGEMTASDAPRPIPKHVGRWVTTLQQGNLLNLVIPQIAVAAVIIGWEEDIFPSTAAMEEARESVRQDLSTQLTDAIQKVVQNCLANPSDCNSDIDFESEISVDQLREVIFDILKEKMAGFVSGAVLLNPLFALAGDRDEFIGYGVAGPFFLPKILGSMPNFREDFTLDLKNGEKDTPGHYRVKGHLALLEPRMWAQPAAVQDDAKVKVIARDPVVDMFFKADIGGGETGPFKRIGQGTFKSGPAAVLSSDGKLMHAFGLGMDDHFWRAQSNNGGKDWQLAWKQMPGLFTSPPAAAMSGDGKKVSVFGRVLDDRIWMATSIDGGAQWAGWKAIPHGLFISGPAACCSADGQRLYVFGTGRDNRIWWALSTNGGKTWQIAWRPILSGILQSGPAAVCSDDGKKVRVFGRGNDQHIWWASSDDSGSHWSGWFRMETGTFISSPAASMSRDGKKVHVFALGGNMLLYRNGSSDFGATYHKKFSRVDDNSTFY